MQSHLHLPPGHTSRGGWRTISAIKVESSERVRAMHRELSAKGVSFGLEPQACPWNAYGLLLHRAPEENYERSIPGRKAAMQI
jgi:hypothetical protein